MQIICISLSFRSLLPSQPRVMTGCRFREWGSLIVVGALVAQSCPTLCHLMDCSPPGSSVQEILQARILEWVAISFSRGSSRPSNQIWVSCIAGGFFTIWATTEAHTAACEDTRLSKFSATRAGAEQNQWSSHTHTLLTPAMGSLINMTYSPPKQQPCQFNNLPLNDWAFWWPRWPQLMCKTARTWIFKGKESWSLVTYVLWRQLLSTNLKLPDVQAAFRKGRGTRDQIANIHWIIEKARESQKNIYFCFIDYAKAFACVDRNKLWKILKEMRIPDHLTCLLRNLYAGQEATVRTGHGTTDWFQVGKGVRTSRLYIVTLLI